MIKYLFLIIVSCFTYNLTAQTKLDTALKNLDENYAQEKIYILYNKEDYIAGENIWFKAFVFDGYKQSTISTNLFVELYDKNKKLIDKKLLPIFRGQSDGSFTLKEDLQEDVYYVRAYTTYMTYFSENFQYVKPVLVHNPTSKLKLIKDENIKWKAEVYTEGGNLIENQTTKFAVRLKSAGDLPKKWNGFIFEKNHPTNKILLFNNLDENIASFYFKAEPNKLYQIQINDKNGNQQIVDLPITRKSGITLKVINEDNNIGYQLRSVGIPQQLKNYKVIGTLNNSVVYTAKFTKEIQTISQKIKYDSLSDENGILQLSVFDANDNIVAQRLTFINHSKKISKPELDFDTNHDARSINTITLKDEFPQDLTAVINRQNNQKDNLLSSLWLTQDFTDNISNPTQYFQEKNNPEALDALLLSENWKRFNWNEVMNNPRKVPNSAINPYLSYKGKAYINGQDLKNADLNLFIETPETEKILIPTSTDSNGNFQLDNLVSYDNFNIFYYLNNQAQKTKKQDDKIIISVLPLFENKKYNSDFPSNGYILSEVSADKQNEIKAQTEQIKINKIVNDKIIRLKEVVVQAQKDIKTKKLNDQLSTGMFRSINETVVDFINDNQNANAYNNIFEFLAGRVAGLTTTLQQGIVTPIIRNGKAAVYLDEMLLSSETLSSININEIALVKVYKGSGMLGNAIAIYTKRGNMGNSNVAKSINVLPVKGYDKILPFLSIDEYETLYKNIPNDKRETLYWNPKLTSEAGNETIIEYFNNDNPKGFQLTIIGFDEKGNPVYYEGKIN